MARFLVVDDDPSSVRAMSTLLASDGHEVSSFTTGAQAVEALARAPFDVVVTDLEMPQVDGHAVARATREHHPSACLVVVTADAKEAWQGLLEAGACIVADKPVEYDEVTRAVGSCRARGGPGLHGTCHMRSGPSKHQLLTPRRK